MVRRRAAQQCERERAGAAWALGAGRSVLAARSAFGAPKCSPAERMRLTLSGKTPSAIFWLKGESFRPLCELKRLPISGWVSEPVVVVVVGVQAENFDCKAT